MGRICIIFFLSDELVNYGLLTTKNKLSSAQSAKMAIVILKLSFSSVGRHQESSQLVMILFDVRFPTRTGVLDKVLEGFHMLRGTLQPICGKVS